MRNLLMLVLCCGVAVAFGLGCRHLFLESQKSRQDQLFGLGALEGMENSPQRLLLKGEFARGLREKPDPETYDKLAALYLVTHNLQGRTVESSAFHDKLMGRVIGGGLELFDAEARLVVAKLTRFDKEGASPNSELFPLDKEPTLWADPPWLRYRDSRWDAAFRWRGDELEGYFYEKKLSVEGDDLVLEEGGRWNWETARFQNASSQHLD